MQSLSLTTSPTNPAPPAGPECRIDAAGTGALLLDGSRGPFDVDVQRRIWSVARKARLLDGVTETVPGMNNLMVVFDALRVWPQSVETGLRDLWEHAVAEPIAGREIEIPVVYGGPKGEDLADLAAHLGMRIHEVVRLHSEAVYTVAAIGAMPGFPYLSGLDPALARNRRPDPRMRVEEGAVMIGGAQAGIMPCTAPSGWHILGSTTLKLFDPERDPPAILQPGDKVRFTVAGVES